MKLLLDTHVVLWWLGRTANLSERAVTAIREPTNEVYVSAVTGCELAQKASVGKLRVPDDLERQLAAHDFAQLPIAMRHGLALKELPPHHRDPFDRLLVAQALAEGLTLMTADQRLFDYDVPILSACE